MTIAKLENPLRVISNEKGILTVDWLFGFILVMGFTALLFSLCLTLTVVEVTQYITFASARNYFASHLNEDRQRQLALEKFEQLKSVPVFAAFYNNDWFLLGADPLIGATDKNPELADYGSPADSKFLFYGVGVQLVAKILDFNIPFFGETLSEDSNPSGFTSYISSYLGRESTVNECFNFNQTRWNAIKRLSNSYSGGFNSRYYTFSDNGC